MLKEIKNHNNSNALVIKTVMEKPIKIRNGTHRVRDHFLFNVFFDLDRSFLPKTAVQTFSESNLFCCGKSIVDLETFHKPPNRFPKRIDLSFI